MNEIIHRLEPQWNDLVSTVTNHPPDPVFSELSAAYTATTRHYHNLQHIEHVLHTIDSLKSLARDLTALQLAAWFHDLVYESRNHDNEERSAARADEILAGWDAASALRDHVTALILATKKHQAADGDIDTQILLDADLAILGETPSRYQDYARAIRQEYTWVSDEDFRKGRGKILQSFLQRDHLYFTPPMQAKESIARQNLQAELKALG